MTPARDRSRNTECFALLAAHPELGAVLALGERVLFEADGRWYRTVPAAPSP